MSYHITKDFGDNNYMFWWPISGFNQFCTNESEAREEFKRITEKQKGYRLVRYPAVINNWGSVIGITGEQEILSEIKI